MVGRRELDQGRAGHRPRGRGMDDRRRAGDRHPRGRHLAVLAAPAHGRARHRRGPPRASTRCTGSCTRPSSGSPGGRPGSARPTTASATSAPCSSRPLAGSGRSGTSPTRALLDRYAGQLMPRTAEWESRWWSPIINAEHLAMRDHAALIDLSAFAVLDVAGPGALAAVQYLAVAQLDVAPGRVVYTSLLDDRGRVPRRPDDHAARGRQVPRRDRRGHRDDGPEVDHRPPAGRLPGRRHRRHLGVDHARAVGAEGQGDPGAGSPPTTCRTRACRSARARRSRPAG